MAHWDAGVGEIDTCLPPTDCQWGNWEEWGACSLTCGGGQHARTRKVRRAMCRNDGPWSNPSILCKRSDEFRSLKNVLKW